MAQSPTERVNTLDRVVHGHDVRLDVLGDQVETTRDVVSEAAKEFVALHRDFDREVALLKREVEELRKWRDDVKKGEEEWGRKLWMILPPVLAVLISNALTFVIAIYVKK